MSSIKSEPIYRGCPLRRTLPFSVNEPTVKCEWSLKGNCVCSGDCSICQTSKSDHLTPLEPSSSLNEPSTDETDSYPDEWENCEAAEDESDRDDATDTEFKLFDSVVEKSEELPMIQQVNVGKINEDVIAKDEEGETCKEVTLKAEEVEKLLQLFEAEEEENVVEDEARPFQVNVSSLPVATLRRSTRARKAVNYVNTMVDEEMMDEDDSETVMEADMETDEDDNSSETEGSSSIDDEPLEGEALGHAATVHQTEVDRPFVCSIDDCEKAFKDRNGLSVHRMLHLGMKAFKCTDCKRAFPKKSQLKRHLKIHTGERPYACTDCGQAFAQRYRLKRHYLKHTGERPHACTVCEQAFAEKSDLKGHFRLHTGERPYVCKVCKKTFNYSWAVKKHERKVHKV